MAKKKNESLTKRIETLISRVGEKPEPTFGQLKSELVNCRTLAQTLEDGEAIREAEAQIAVLQAALEESKTARQQSDAENEKLKAELKSAQVKARRYQEELKKKEEKKWDIPDIQFQILKVLPSETSGSPLRLKQVAYAVKIPVDEAEIHFDTLKQMGLATKLDNDSMGTTWRRSLEGNKLVVSKRLAGEEADQKAYKHADLPEAQHEALLMIGGSPNGANEDAIAEKLGATMLSTRRYLGQLREADMATAGNEPQATYGTGDMWWLLENGTEYLAERNLL